MDLTEAENIKKRWQEYTESESESEVAQSCLTLCAPMDCSPPCSSVHGIFQARARVLKWGTIAFSAKVVLPKPKSKITPAEVGALCSCPGVTDTPEGEAL